MLATAPGPGLSGRPAAAEHRPGQRPPEAAARVLAQLVVLVYTGRTFLPTAYDLLAAGRPPAGQQPVVSSGSAALTRLLTILLCLCVLAFLAHAPALRFPALAAATTGLVLAEVLAAVRSGNAALLPPLLAASVLLVAMSSALPRQSCLRLARRCLAPVVLGSLGLAVLLPALAKYGLTEAAWGTRDARLAGLTTQPNTLGAVAGLLCVVLLAGRRSRSTPSLFLASLVALYLTQSYTSWLATAVAVAIVLSSRRRVGGSGGVVVPLAAGCTLVGLTLLALTRLGFTEQLGTVSGRRVLWDLVLQRWSEAPLLGHGPQVWSELIAVGVLPPWAVHAHNQLLNSLFVAGLLGVAALAWLGTLLVLHSLRCWSVGWALGAALVAFQLVRSYSEVPFELFFGGFNVVVLAVAGAALLAQAEDGLSSGAPESTTPKRQEQAPAWTG